MFKNLFRIWNLEARKFLITGYVHLLFCEAIWILFMDLIKDFFFYLSRLQCFFSFFLVSFPSVCLSLISPCQGYSLLLTRKNGLGTVQWVVTRAEGWKGLIGRSWPQAKLWLTGEGPLLWRVLGEGSWGRHAESQLNCWWILGSLEISNNDVSSGFLFTIHINHEFIVL